MNSEGKTTDVRNWCNSFTGFIGINNEKLLWHRTSLDLFIYRYIWSRVVSSLKKTILPRSCFRNSLIKTKCKTFASFFFKRITWIILRTRKKKTRKTRSCQKRVNYRSCLILARSSIMFAYRVLRWYTRDVRFWLIARQKRAFVFEGARRGGGKGEKMFCKNKRDTTSEAGECKSTHKYTPNGRTQ